MRPENLPRLTASVTCVAGESGAGLEERREASLDALTTQYKGVSERTRAVLAEQADQMVLAYDETEEQIRKLRLGIDVLDEKARAIELTLTDPFLNPARWQEPEAHFALKRALNLLVHAMTLRKEGPGAYYVEVEIYEIRESVSLESMYTIFFTKTTRPRRYVGWQASAV